MDYVLKTNLARLGPAVRRALDEAAAHAARRKAEKHVRRLTYFDPLTGLAKRTLFCERIGRQLAEHGDPSRIARPSWCSMWSV